ncbi:MAG: NAD(P)-dependent alcohol dehydrogenase, partial [Myxococcales bacterium]|nr:NAD(P)-dependent alcohol dehydrogenase [Myxococcales bacterium]
MKAITCRAYGPPEVLTVVDVEQPTPGPHEILVEIHASTVNSSDWYVRSGVRTAPLFMQLMFRLRVGFTRPRKPILGLIVVGRVVEVGSKVTRFRPGQRVWAFTKFHFGAYAEYTCLADDSSVGLAPDGWSDEDAAAIVFGGLLALHYVRRGRVAKGERVLVYGASGGAGTALVQLAAHEGAQVTAVCGPGSAELVRSLGATAVLDYT